MQPWWHFAISLTVSYILVASLSLDITTGINWIIVGCVFGTLIDFDHIIFSLVTKRKAAKIILRDMFIPRKLIKDFKFKHPLFISPIKMRIFQIFTSLTLLSITLYILPSYYLLVGIVLLVHNISDIPEVISYLKKSGKYTKKA